MTQTIYRDTDKEAREAVRRFKRTLPACIRRTVRYMGHSILVGSGQERISAFFEDANGKHRIIISE
jgi:hypothetical protein